MGHDLDREMMYLAEDQYGNRFYLHDNPRKELLERHGRKHADKMYHDRPDGTYHVGYIVAGHWYTVIGLEGITFARRVS